MAADFSDVATRRHASFPIFTGVNYRMWSIKMRTIFASMELLDVVENVIPTTVLGINDNSGQREINTVSRVDDNIRIRENKRRDALALSYIHEAVDEDIFQKIAGANTAHEAWDILRQEYSANTEYVPQHRRRDNNSSLVYRGLLIAGVSIIASANYPMLVAALEQLSKLTEADGYVLSYFAIATYTGIIITASITFLAPLMRRGTKLLIAASCVASILFAVSTYGAMQTVHDKMPNSTRITVNTISVVDFVISVIALIWDKCT